MKTEKAVFAAGCFWGVEEIFARQPGAVSTRVGYTGGSVKRPYYAMVCAGATGHAEAVEITFDTAKTSFEKLLAVFWRIHDPTQRNRQGPDVGSQYRSAIFYRGDSQRRAAEYSKQVVSAGFSKSIATEITPAGVFYPAEEYHQHYARKHPGFACHY